MSTILYVWEIGGGLGHLLRFAPLAEMLVARGHRVVAAVRESKNAGHAFAGTAVEFLPAPHLNWPAPGAIDPVYTYAELLHNIGFGRADDLRTLTAAWRTLFALCRPESSENRLRRGGQAHFAHGASQNERVTTVLVEASRLTCPPDTLKMAGHSLALA